MKIVKECSVGGGLPGTNDACNISGISSTTLQPPASRIQTFRLSSPKHRGSEIKNRCYGTLLIL